jgi:ribosomal protein S18 acetylase RimI-like enzyme
VNDNIVRVSYLDLTQTPTLIPTHVGAERISRVKLSVDDYLDLYGRIGRPVRWDQRFKMPRSELTSLLQSERSQLYLLVDDHGRAIGFCEFERSLPDIELRNFGLVPSAQGRGLGSWLLRTALHEEWKLQPARIRLHTDNWDHPAAVHLYESAGFQVHRVREEPAADL